ncbi:MAG: SPOR domain-containing protein [Bacteroidota bacterium]|jgi:hypothetical protein
MREHEKSFDPSEYRKKEVEQSTKTEEKTAAVSNAEPAWIERTEKVMGYRVQLHSTPSLDEASATLTQMRSRLDSMQIDPGRLDMSFDAPYYKIRAGDFLLKTTADSLREQLRTAGMNEAWIVRDNVFRIIRERQK